MSHLWWNNRVKLTARLGENNANMRSTNLFIPTKAMEHEMHPLPHDTTRAKTTVFIGLIRKASALCLKAGGRIKKMRERREKQCHPSVRNTFLIFAATTKERKSAVHPLGIMNKG